MGSKITRLTPHAGVLRRDGGAITLFGATWLGIPVSTTHTITGAIVGVGAARRVSAVRWNVAVGALCWRLGEDDRIAFLLVTSRDTGRWVTPKGNRMKGLSDAEAAAEEAMEEAGATGLIEPAPFGTFTYDKRLAGRARRQTAVDVYSLQVTHLFDSWPEAHERERRWVQPAGGGRGRR
jgi:8-oxo-dGTP pyrophosphatase MutT (NUDIX family)